MRKNEVEDCNQGRKKKQQVYVNVLHEPKDLIHDFNSFNNVFNDRTLFSQ